MIPRKLRANCLKKLYKSTYTRSPIHIPWWWTAPRKFCIMKHQTTNAKHRTQKPNLERSRRDLRAQSKRVAEYRESLLPSLKKYEERRWNTSICPLADKMKKVNMCCSFLYGLGGHDLTKKKWPLLKTYTLILVHVNRDLIYTSFRNRLVWW